MLNFPDTSLSIQVTLEIYAMRKIVETSKTRLDLEIGIF